MRATSLTLRLSAAAAALGLLALGTAALLGSVKQARADALGPEVTGGTHPYVSSSGILPPASNNTIYTVPNDRILIVTGVSVNSLAHLYQDNTLKVQAESSQMFTGHIYGFVGALAAGNGKVVFEPGSNVVLRTPGGNATTYYLQGYLAHP